MNGSKFEEFRKVASARARSNDQTALEIGEEGWLIGEPYPSDADTLAIVTSSGLVVTVREADVRELRRTGDQFMLRLPRGASTLVRLEATVAFEPGKAGDCGCGGQEGEVMAAPARRGQIFKSNALAGDGILNPDWCVVCELVYVPGLCDLPGTDRVVVCFELVMECRDICEDTILV